ncbi:MAG TPA: hypothetical protein VN706_10060 [Gemmatimonadaceae bacterium]|nr:hypothetical protein [Gemmatimonadaceae bacterium]
MPQTLNRVLVLADGPVVAALIGMLVETTGRTPVFANPNEVPSDALERTRPIAAVIIDASLSAAESDLFFAAAAKWDIGVAVFGPESAARRIAEIAAGRRIPWFTMPPTADQLARALDVAIGTQSRRGAERRSAPSEALVAPDGTRILRDTDGCRWMVYDRRVSNDRRASDGDTITVRVFVSEVGEALECGLGEMEIRQATASALELQLSRCVRS